VRVPGLADRPLLTAPEDAGQGGERGGLAAQQEALEGVGAGRQQVTRDGEHVRGRHPVVRAGVGEVAERPPAVRAAAGARQARVAGEQAPHVGRAGRGRRRPDVVPDQVRLLREQPPGGRPAVRPVVAGVGQAGQPAELGGGVGGRRRRHRTVPAVVGHHVEVPAQPRPAREPVLAGDDELGGGEPERGRVGGRPAGVVPRGAGEPGRVAGAHRALQGAGPAAQAVQVGTVGQGRRHRGLLSSA
jgi:hypothetical protein